MPDPQRAFQRLSKLHINSYTRPLFVDDARVQTIISRASAPAGASVAELLAEAGSNQGVMLQRTLGWLLKLGVLGLLPPNSNGQR
jgi:hypothetical protein